MRVPPVIPFCDPMRHTIMLLFAEQTSRFPIVILVLVFALRTVHAYLVVVVDHLARVDDGEVGLETCRLRLRFRSDEHVLGEVVLPRQLRDDAHVLA